MAPQCTSRQCVLGQCVLGQWTLRCDGYLDSTLDRTPRPLAFRDQPVQPVQPAPAADSDTCAEIAFGRDLMTHGLVRLEVGTPPSLTPPATAYPPRPESRLLVFRYSVRERQAILARQGASLERHRQKRTYSFMHSFTFSYLPDLPAARPAVAPTSFYLNRGARSSDRSSTSRSDSALCS